VLAATYITLEAPSRDKHEPARSFASAVAAREWRALWVYLMGPPLGVLVAAETDARLRGLRRVFCAKLDHGGATRCIFRCNYAVPGVGLPECHP
jgi:aquaporin Z